jgi:hypothetical protein
MNIKKLTGQGVLEMSRPGGAPESSPVIHRWEPEAPSLASSRRDT